MLIYLCKMFVVSLLLTECIESITAWCLGMRKKRNFLLIILVNCLTNPVVVYLIWIVRAYGRTNEEVFSTVIYIMIEIFVVVIEGFIYRCYMKENKYPFLFSLCVNVISYGIGCLI